MRMLQEVQGVALNTNTKSAIGLTEQHSMIQKISSIGVWYLPELEDRKLFYKLAPPASHYDVNPGKKSFKDIVSVTFHPSIIENETSKHSQNILFKENFDSSQVTNQTDTNLLKKESFFNQVKEPVPTSNQVKQPVTTSSQVKEPVSTSNQIKEPVLTSNQVKWSFPTSNQVKEPVPTSNQVKQSVPTSNQVKEPVTSSNQVKWSVPTSNQIKESVPTPNQVKWSVPTPNQVKESVSTLYQVKEPVSTSNQVKEPVLTPNQVNEPVSTSNQVKEPLSTSNQVKEPVSTFNQVKEPVPTSNQIKEPVTSSNQVKEPVTFSNQVKQSVPTSNQVKWSVPTSNQVKWSVSSLKSSSNSAFQDMNILNSSMSTVIQCPVSQGQLNHNDICWGPWSVCKQPCPETRLPEEPYMMPAVVTDQSNERYVPLVVADQSNERKSEDSSSPLVDSVISSTSITGKEVEAQQRLTAIKLQLKCLKTSINFINNSIQVNPNKRWMTAKPCAHHHKHVTFMTSAHDDDAKSVWNVMSSVQTTLNKLKMELEQLQQIMSTETTINNSSLIQELAEQLRQVYNETETTRDMKLWKLLFGQRYSSRAELQKNVVIDQCCSSHTQLGQNLEAELGQDLVTGLMLDSRASEMRLSLNKLVKDILEIVNSKSCICHQASCVQ